MDVGCAFDWYRAGIDDSPDYILARLQDGLGRFGNEQLRPSVRRLRPNLGYRDSAGLFHFDRRLCTISWGGNTGERIMVEGTGCEAPAVASLVKSEWPSHYLLRADVAIDVDMPDAWDSLYSMATNLADQFDLKVKNIGDYHRAVDGRTVQVGANTSPVKMRIYEKGIERRVNAGITNLSTNLVRVETEVKPRKTLARLHCATLSPVELMGCAPFTAEAARLLLGESVRRVTGLNRLKRPSDRERALSHMVQQYGKHLDSLLEELGSWCAVGEHLGSIRSGDDI